MKFKLIFIISILFILILSFSSAKIVYRDAPTINFTPSEEAIEIGNNLNISENDMDDMLAKGFKVIRYNDTLTIAKQMYYAQIALAKSGGKTDFLLIQQKIDELTNLKKIAFLASDELKALELAINQTKSVDLSPALEIYAQAKESFDSERYETALTLIDKTYEKISELEAFDTQLKAFYEATSTSLINFLKQRWKVILIFLTVIILSSILTYNSIIIFSLKNKLNDLETRKDSIRKLIAKTQKEYFEDGKLSETTYKTRVTKYAELIRDINRQIPLLREELEIRLKKRKRI